MPNVDVRAEFRRTADKYRKVKPLVLVLTLAAFLAMVYYMQRNWMIGFGNFFGVLVLTSFLEPSLICPACKKNLKDSPISLCPKCGSDTLAPNTWRGSLLCSACGSKLYFRGGRGRYSVRFCPHCGAHVDDRGV
jgi:rRNA maturation endonuclease Nob1